MASNKTRQLLRILKWKALLVSSQDNDKMDAIVQCRGIFYKCRCSGKDYVEEFNFRLQIKNDVKNIKEFKEIIRYFFSLFFLRSFYLVLLLPTATPNSRIGMQLRRYT